MLKRRPDVIQSSKPVINVYIVESFSVNTLLQVVHCMHPWKSSQLIALRRLMAKVSQHGTSHHEPKNNAKCKIISLDPSTISIDAHRCLPIRSHKAQSILSSNKTSEYYQ